MTDNKKVKTEADFLEDGLCTRVEFTKKEREAITDAQNVVLREFQVIKLNKSLRLLQKATNDEVTREELMKALDETAFDLVMALDILSVKKE